ncbi:ankyrin repeat domain 49 isoform X1 [Pelobates cultripes]|uniref:Ankyrin repeat domain 49 isoform X1 n=1 Tax=Pelobates cultripes TaxID=61616 RepID=A0AAD1S4I9_PELCU|nr:ankyrin repeat domain 49 isoform X1 [Pelobates cultripes]
MPKCLIKGCPSKTGGQTDAFLHMFPRNIKRITEWLQRTGHKLEDLPGFAEKVLEDKKGYKYRICSTHFPETVYTMKGSRKCLTEFAIPELNLEIQSNVKERIFSSRRKRPKINGSEAQTSTTTIMVDRGMNTEQLETRNVSTETDDQLGVDQSSNFTLIKHIKIESNDDYMVEGFKRGAPLVCTTHPAEEASQFKGFIIKSENEDEEQSQNFIPIKHIKQESNDEDYMVEGFHHVAPLVCTIRPSEEASQFEKFIKTEKEDEDQSQNLTSIKHVKQEENYEDYMVEDVKRVAPLACMSDPAKETSLLKEPTIKSEKEGKYFNPDAPSEYEETYKSVAFST